MAVMSLNRDRGGGMGVLVALVLLAAAAWALLYTLDLSHGEERHGPDAVLVRQCLDRGGPMQVWHNPLTGNWANVCQVRDGLFGVQILNGADDEITAFVKNKMRRLEQVENYLTRSGYTRAQ